MLQSNTTASSFINQHSDDNVDDGTCHENEQHSDDDLDDGPFNDDEASTFMKIVGPLQTHTCNKMLPVRHHVKVNNKILGVLLQISLI